MRKKWTRYKRVASLYSVCSEYWTSYSYTLERQAQTQVYKIPPLFVSDLNHIILCSQILVNLPNIWVFLWWRAPQQKLRTHRSLEAYCATLWWIWLVFSFFRVMGQRWNETDRGKSNYSGENLSQCHFVHHKSHMDTRDRTRASAVRGRRLTAWAMARPNIWVSENPFFGSRDASSAQTDGQTHPVWIGAPMDS
jgi:hypothetical protein